MKKFNSWKRVGWLMALLFAPRVVCAELASTVKIAFDNVAGVESNVMVFSSGNVGGYPTGSDGVPAGAFSAQTVKLNQSLLGAYVANPIDVSGFYGVGEWLSPPAGTSADAAHPPVVSPTNLAVYSEGRVLAVAQGLLTVTWWNAAAQTHVEYTYLIAQFASTSSVPVMVFHTESPAAGPKVDFSSIAAGADVVVCPNDLIQSTNLWIDSTNRLHATGRVGLAVVLFKSKSTGVITGREVVEVRAYAPTVSSANVAAGSWLAPYQTNATQCAYSYVVRGKEGSYPYVYQHGTVADANYYGRILAVAPNSTPANVEVCWLRAGLYGIQWPYELRQYTSSWPTQPSVWMQPTEAIPSLEGLPSHLRRCETHCPSDAASGADPFTPVQV